MLGCGTNSYIIIARGHCTAGGMRRWQAVVEALEGLDGGGSSSAVVDALQTKQGKATVFMADTLLYVDMRRRRLRWSIKLPHLTTVTTHGTKPICHSYHEGVATACRLVQNAADLVVALLVAQLGSDACCRAGGGGEPQHPAIRAPVRVVRRAAAGTAPRGLRLPRDRAGGAHG
jgi:hypothetical protein